VRVRAERALSKPDFGLGTVGSADVVAVAEWMLELPNDVTDRKPFQPPTFIADSHVRDVRIRILVIRRLVDAHDSFARHLLSSPETSVRRIASAEKELQLSGARGPGSLLSFWARGVAAEAELE
jgi:hypothetical protein